MTDRDRVVRDLRYLKSFGRVSNNPQITEIAEEAIELLKEQEAKHGEWIDIWREDDPDTSSHARCSVCNRISTRPVGAYCKWCGAKMDDEVEGR